MTHFWLAALGATTGCVLHSAELAKVVPPPIDPGDAHEAPAVSFLLDPIPAGEARFHVVDELGVDLPAARVELRRTESGAGGIVWITDAKGIAHVTSLTPGSYRWLITRSGFLGVRGRLELSAESGVSLYVIEVLDRSQPPMRLK